jgi:pyrroloquinoline quinone biosynthesis protein E
MASPASVPAPIAMLAELTYRCPLSCPYCSNPVEMAKKDSELDTDTWLDVFDQAAKLGVLQLHLSGGEPASRRDLVALVAGARKAGLYTNLITSAIGLTQRRLAELEQSGLDHVQLSLQGTDAEMADRIGGYKGGFARKMQAAEWIVEAGFPLTLNAVVHRQNLHQLPNESAANGSRHRPVSRLGHAEPRSHDANARTSRRSQPYRSEGPRTAEGHVGNRLCAR